MPTQTHEEIAEFEHIEHIECVTEKEKQLAEKRDEKERRRQAKVAYNAAVKMHKQEEKENARKLKQERKEKRRKEKSNRPLKWFHFFTKWFFLGLSLIIASVFFSLIPAESHTLFTEIQRIVSGVLSSLGVALVIGAIFDFSKNSEAFVHFVSNILSDIVVSKAFLTRLSESDKQEALALIIKPSDKEIEQYSNINSLFKKRIHDLSTMFDYNFKTNVVLNITAYYDKEKKVVTCKTDLTNTMYKISKAYTPIRVMFEKPNSTIDNVCILPPEGHDHEIKGISSDIKVGGVDFKQYSFEIPQEYQKFDHITIRRTMIEPGSAHWINYYWQSLTPYEGLNCAITCMDNLVIKDWMIFDNKAYYHVDIDKNGQHMEIASSQWLDTDTDFVVTIGERDDEV